MGQPDLRILTLALPSLLVLVLLVLHSWRTLPRRRAIGFWVAVTLYGLLRGLGVRAITNAIGARFPYEIHNPLMSIAGVSVQEVVGWAIVAYLGWWLGHRMSRPAHHPLFLQIAWGALFLGAVSWAVESTAVASGWWHWTVPTASRLFLNVPLIGLIDWLFVATDFLLPFLVITAPSLRGRPARFLSLLLFPLHFGSHAFLDPIVPAIPIPLFHFVHWLLLGMVIALATLSDVKDEAFQERGQRIALLPLIAAGLMAADAVGVLLFAVHNPRLLPTVGPLIALTVASVTTPAAVALTAAGAAGALFSASMGLTAIPLLIRAALGFLRRHRKALPVVLISLAAIAFATHARSARRNMELKTRLDHALTARNAGRIDVASAELTALTRDFPTTYAPFALLGEIDYRMDRLQEALPLYERATEIKGDFLPGFRYASVIALRQGDPKRALAGAERGLAVEPDDLQLRYLQRRARRDPIDDLLTRITSDARTAEQIAALAFEVDDTASAVKIVDAALARHPHQRTLYGIRVRLALAEGKPEAARVVLERWMARFPDDPEPRNLAARLR